jgi:serine protease Do
MKKYWPLLILGLILGFAGGMVASSLSPRNPGLVQDRVEEAQQTSTSAQARAALSQFSEAFEEAANKVSSSVVSIFAEQVVEQQSPFGLPDEALRDFFGDDFFRRFFDIPELKGEKRTVRSLGSGVIVSKDGYILTNNHVVENSQKLSVVIGDKKKYEAKVVGADPRSDVAVIKINAKDLAAATLGNSDECKVGQWVIAVGNPFSLMHTVTAGIISAKGRSEVTQATYQDFLQTDAAINPGNSGGALADLDGRVIGINTAIVSPSGTGGNVGIGFAIPINMAKEVMEALISKGKVTRGYFALSPQDVDDDLAKALKLRTTEGSLVTDVTPGGAADKAGIKKGDFIIEFNGKKVKNTADLVNMVAETPPGSSVKIVLIRDSQTKEVTAVVGEQPGERPERPARPEKKQEQVNKKLGLGIQDLTPAIARQLGYQGDSGALVIDVDAGSPAEDAGLQRGDLIKEANRVEVKSVEDFNKAMSGLKSGDTAALYVRHGQAFFFTTIAIQ